MPNLDGTGPMGRGSMTGRGMGQCTEYGGNYAPGIGPGMGRGAGMRGQMGGGRGFGQGRGFGRGFCRWQTFNYTPEQEKTELQNEVEVLKTMLKNAEERLKLLEKEE